jgi:hypothetical protein
MSSPKILNQRPEFNFIRRTDKVLEIAGAHTENPFASI